MIQARYLKTFWFWSQHVLPLVYDDSLSYYEVLSKCVDYTNALIKNDNDIIKTLEEYGLAIDELEKSLDELKNGEYNQIIEDYIAKVIKMVFFGLTDSGYFVANIPDSWDEITFNTTGYDVFDTDVDYGHLTLSY